MALSAAEQLVLEMINRARLDPAGEASRLGISLNEGLAAGTISSAAKQPLASNGKLANAAQGHSQHMLGVDQFAHEGIGDGTPTTRMTAAGYAFSGSWLNGENIAFSGTTGSIDANAFAIKNQNDLFVDKDYSGRGHRVDILNADFREVGIGYVTGVYTSGGTNYNTGMLTQDFAKTGSNIFITGVAINDTNNNNFYDIGEGRGGIAVKIMSGATVLGNATSETAGGYNAAIVPPSSSVAVTFSGGGLAHDVSVTLATPAQNVKVDLCGASKILSSASTTLGAGATSLVLLGAAGLSGTGSAGNDTIAGNKAANFLNGAAGNDVISGGAGADTIIGGNGRDVMTGGAGNDQFRFNSMSELGNSATTRDIITDMLKTAATGADKINVSALDARTGEGTADDAFILRAAKGAAFTGIGQLRWTQEDLAGTASDKTIIYANTDHNLATSEFQIEIKGLVTLAAGDFLL